MNIRSKTFLNIFIHSKNPNQNQPGKERSKKRKKTAEETNKYPIERVKLEIANEAILRNQELDRLWRELNP